MNKKGCTLNFLKHFVNILVVSVIAIAIYQLEADLENMANRVRFANLAPIQPQDEQRLNQQEEPFPGPVMRAQANLVRNQFSTSFRWSQFEEANGINIPGGDGIRNAEIIEVPKRIYDFTNATKRTIGNYCEYVFLKYSDDRHVYVEGTAVDGEIERRDLNEERNRHWTKYGRRYDNAIALEMKGAKQEEGVDRYDVDFVDKRYKYSRENIIGLYTLNGMSGRIYACNVTFGRTLAIFEYRYMTYAEAIYMQLASRKPNGNRRYALNKQLFYTIARILNTEGGIPALVAQGAYHVNNAHLNNYYDDGQVEENDEREFQRNVRRRYNWV